MLGRCRISSTSRPSSRGFSLVLTVFYPAKPGVSFIPTASFVDHESHEQRLKDQEAAVPSRPVVDSSRRLYSDIVKPKDTCDLFWRPSYEDYVVTCLAKQCPVAGDLLYEVVSRSKVKESKLMFANMAISWLKLFDSQIATLKEFGRSEDELQFQKSDPKLAHYLNDNVFASVESLQTFTLGLLEKNFTLESVVHFLLSQTKSLENFNTIFHVLGQNVHALNPASLKDLVTYIVRYVSEIRTSESELAQYAKTLDTCLREKLLLEYPGVLSQLSVSTLDKLTRISSLSGDFQTAVQALAVLSDVHKTAPAEDTWTGFMDRYSGHAYDQSLMKAQILIELSPLKSVIFHHGLTKNSFLLLLTKSVDNVHDLAHFVQLTKSISPTLLAEHAAEVSDRLQYISEASNESEIIKNVRAAQLARTLRGVESAELLA